MNIDNLPIEAYFGTVDLIKNGTTIRCYSYIDVGYRYHPLAQPEPQKITKCWYVKHDDIKLNLSNFYTTGGFHRFLTHMINKGYKLHSRNF